MVKTRDITVLAWNLRDGLSDPSRADALAEKIDEINPDIAIFSEGALEGHRVTRSAKAILERQDRRIYEADYMDIDDRRDRHRLVAVAKPDFGEPSVRPAYGRNAFFFMNGTLPLKVAGLHGFDRDQESVKLSDEARVRQIKHTIARLALGPDSQAIVMGDLNSMYPNGFRATMLRAAMPVTDLLPYKNPGEDQSRMERLGSLSQRLARMATGGSLEVLREAGFSGSNPHRQGTMQVGPLSVQLDHILGRRVELYGHELVEPDDLTDHYGIKTKANIFLRNGRPR
jgi:hypothetical protein